MTLRQNIEHLILKIKNKIKDKKHYSEIRKKQNILFKGNFKNTKKMIVFVNFADNDFCGGVMTIFHFANISRQMKDIHGCEVIHANFFNEKKRCYPSQNKFKNDETMYRLEQVMEKAPKLDKLILHVPELMMKNLAIKIEKYKNNLKKVKDLQINVLNQNEEVFSEPKEWKSLWKITKNITQTTGFDKYTTQEISNYYQLPLYRLIGYNGLHEEYEKTGFDTKENLIIYSPDPHPLKESIIKHLKSNLHDYKFKEVSGITFDEYMQLCQKAKYSLTFGEGFDGYFTTIQFVGGLGFSVYNETFFPCVDYLNFKTIYSSYEELNEKIVKDINYLDEDENEYNRISKEIEALNIKTTYNKQLTYDLLEKFYKKEPTFVPSKNVRVDYKFKKRVTFSSLAIDKVNERNCKK